VTRKLKLQTLGNGVTALLKEYEACLGSAAGVCLEDQGHTPTVKMQVTGCRKDVFALDWRPIPDEAKRTWENEQQTTEFGACGVALLLARSIAQIKAFRVSRKPSGFDFWMTSRDSVYPFQQCARLEVSGIRCGSEMKKSRLQEKIDRLHRYPNPVPAFIIIIEFGEPGALVEQQQ